LTEGIRKDHDEDCGNLPGTIRMPQNQSADPSTESSVKVIEFYKSIGFLQEDVINIGKRLIPDLK